MKLVLTVVVVGLILTLAFPLSGLAYSGVDGTVLDDNGNPWTHGGQIYLLVKGTHADWATYAPGNAHYSPTLFATGIIGPTGDFSISWGDNPLGSVLSTNPPPVADFWVLFVLDSGPNGQPQNKEISFVNYGFVPENYHAGSVTVTPTAVTVGELEARANGFVPGELPMWVVAILALAAILSIGCRRRIGASGKSRNWG